MEAEKRDPGNEVADRPPTLGREVRKLHMIPRLHAIANFTIFLSFAKKNQGRNDFSLFRIFRYFLFFSHLPNGALKFNKFCEDCEKSWSQRFAAFFISVLLFLIAREGFRFQLIEKGEKSSLTLLFFLTSSSLSRKTDVKLKALV